MITISLTQAGGAEPATGTDLHNTSKFLCENAWKFMYED